MHTLTKAGFLEVVMGKKGGYRIHPGKRDLYLYEIVGAIEGLDSYNRCILGFETCSNENPCSLHTYWLKYQQGLKEMIYNISLNDLEQNGQTKY
jgi:Rrf2 family protein